MEAAHSSAVVATLLEDDFDPVSELYALPEADPATAVAGAWRVVFSPSTGEVIRHDLDPYRSEAVAGIEHDVKVFDVEEWRRENPDRELSGRVVDFFDLGYWRKDGKYMPPLFR